jgi:NAD(P)-dependent dehydrogenase (short-subunit alcohol dehydrogenase family)
MELNLNNKVALVTGAGQGVGRRIAIELAAEGCKVLVNDLYEERARKVAGEICEAGGTAIGVGADITDLDQVRGMFKRMRDTLGTIDILVNNAGVPPMRRDAEGASPLFLETTLDEQAMMVNLNVHGTIYCCRESLTDMVARKSGKIINVISEAGRAGESRLAIYSAAKAAILGLTMALAREHGRDAINVNAIALGAVAHEGIKAGATSLDATPQNNERLAKMLKLYPVAVGLQRLGRPEDAAAAVAFLASDRAAFITGQSLGVSGGYHMQ